MLVPGVRFRWLRTLLKIPVIVYRDRKCLANTTTLFHALRSDLARLRYSLSFDHQCISELLIEYGNFESAVTDRLCANQDFSGPVIDLLRQTSVLLGRLFFHSWNQNNEQVAKSAAEEAFVALLRDTAGKASDVSQDKVVYWQNLVPGISRRVCMDGGRYSGGHG